jgi:hypothetical protein
MFDFHSGLLGKLSEESGPCCFLVAEYTVDDAYCLIFRTCRLALPDPRRATQSLQTSMPFGR